MKTSHLLVLLAMYSTPTFPAVVHSAKMDQAFENIMIDVSYKGGCKKHQFKFELHGCFETNPPLTCVAEIIDGTKNDQCSNSISETIAISLKDNYLDDPRLQGARFRIFGSKKANGDASMAEVTLP